MFNYNGCDFAVLIKENIRDHSRYAFLSQREAIARVYHGRLSNLSAKVRLRFSTSSAN